MTGNYPNTYAPQDAQLLARDLVVNEYQKNPYPGFRIGIPEIDEKLFQLRSNVVVLQGRTNHGKSALARHVEMANTPNLKQTPDEIIIKCMLEDTIEEMAIMEASATTARHRDIQYLSVGDIVSGKMNREQLYQENW